VALAIKQHALTIKHGRQAQEEGAGVVKGPVGMEFTGWRSLWLPPCGLASSWIVAHILLHLRRGHRTTIAAGKLSLQVLGHRRGAAPGGGLSPRAPSATARIDGGAAVIRRKQWRNGGAAAAEGALSVSEKRRGSGIGISVSFGTALRRELFYPAKHSAACGISITGIMPCLRACTVASASRVDKTAMDIAALALAWRGMARTRGGEECNRRKRGVRSAPSAQRRIACAQHLYLFFDTGVGAIGRRNRRGVAA